MKMECEVIRDLLPLYADDACSEQSRFLVDEHLAECADCRGMLLRLRETSIETSLQTEKNTVIEYGAKKFKRRSSLVGTVIAGVFMIPILVCLIVNLASGHSLDWFFVVLASLGVGASLIIVPLMAAENKALNTLGAFTVSLMILLAVTCLYSRGTWFWIASAAVLFGLAVIFLPFVIRAKPVRALTGGGNPLLLVLGLDVTLFVHMMNMIFARRGFGPGNAVLLLGTIAGIGMTALEIMRKRGIK